GGRGPGRRVCQIRGITRQLQALPPTLVGVGEQARAQGLAGLTTGLAAHQLDGGRPLPRERGRQEFGRDRTTRPTLPTARCPGPAQLVRQLGKGAEHGQLRGGVVDAAAVEAPIGKSARLGQGRRGQLQPPAPQLLAQGLVLAGGRAADGQRGQQQPQGVGVDGVEQVGFGVDGAVERALRQARGLHEVGGGGGLQAALGETGQGLVQQPGVVYVRHGRSREGMSALARAAGRPARAQQSM
nr:hypothetical protein [Tanacetum cinerariifolium]